jgi:hypothetical protein
VSWPPLNHVLFIPVAIGIGFIIGWTLASRTVRGEWDRAEKKRRAREEEG